MESEDAQKEESEHGGDDKSDMEDEIVENPSLNLRLRCTAFNKYVPGFKSVLKEFFDNLKVEAPMVRKSDSTFLYLLMKSRKDMQRLLNLREEWAAPAKLFKSPVGVEDMTCKYDLVEKRYPEGVSTALDILVPFRFLSYDSQVDMKMQNLKGFIIQADDELKALLRREKRLGERYFPFLPTFHDPIKVACDTHLDCNFVDINFEYNEETNQAAAGLNVTYKNIKGAEVGAPRRLTTLVPIEMCSHIALPIIKVTESFVQYLNSNLDSLGEYKAINPDTKTGLVNRLNATSNEKGEVLLTVVLSYFTTIDEMIPLDEIDDKVTLSDVWRQYMDAKNMHRGNGEIPKEDPCKFIADRYNDNSLEFKLFDFNQAESHLAIMEPFLKKFYQENKDSLNLIGIYVNWYNTSKRPSDWNRRMATFHHICGSHHIENIVADVVIRRIPFAPTNVPKVSNYGELLTITLKKMDVIESTPLVLFCEYRSLCIFFAKKFKTLMVLNCMKDTDQLTRSLSESTGNEVTFIGENILKMDFGFRKLLKPYEHLVAWGHTIRKQALKRLIVLGVKKIAFVFEKVIVAAAAKATVTSRLLSVQLLRINSLVYPYLTLVEIIPVDCNPGGCHFSMIALYEANKEAPPLPPAEFKLPDDLERALAVIHGTVIEKKTNKISKKRRKKLREQEEKLQENKELVESKELTELKELTKKEELMEKDKLSVNVELMDIEGITEVENKTVKRPAGDFGSPAAKRGRSSAPVSGHGATPARGYGASPAFGRVAVPAHGSNVHAGRVQDYEPVHGNEQAFGRGASHARECSAAAALGRVAVPAHERDVHKAHVQDYEPAFGHAASPARGRGAAPALRRVAVPAHGADVYTGHVQGYEPVHRNELAFERGAAPERGHGATSARGRDVHTGHKQDYEPFSRSACDIGGPAAKRRRAAANAHERTAEPVPGRDVQSGHLQDDKPILRNDPPQPSWLPSKHRPPIRVWDEPSSGSCSGQDQGRRPPVGDFEDWKATQYQSKKIISTRMISHEIDGPPIRVWDEPSSGSFSDKEQGRRPAVGHSEDLEATQYQSKKMISTKVISHEIDGSPIRVWDEPSSGSFSGKDQGRRLAVGHSEDWKATQYQSKKMISHKIDGSQAGNSPSRGPPRNLGRSGRAMDDYDFMDDHHQYKSRGDFPRENKKAGGKALHNPSGRGSYDTLGRNLSDCSGYGADNREAHGGGRVTPYDKVDVGSRRSNPNHGIEGGNKGYERRGDTGASGSAQPFPRGTDSYKIPGRNQTDCSRNDVDNKEAHGGGRVTLYDESDLDSRRSNPNHGKEGWNKGYGRGGDTGASGSAQQFPRGSDPYKIPGRDQTDCSRNDVDSEKTHGGGRVTLYDLGDLETSQESPNPSHGIRGAKTGYWRRENTEAGGSAQHYPAESCSYDIPGRDRIDYRGNYADNREVLGGGRVAPYDQDELDTTHSNPNHEKGGGNAGSVRRGNTETGSSAQLYSTEIGSYDIPSRNRIDYRGNDADNREAHGGGRVAQCGLVDLDSRRSNPNHGKGGGKMGYWRRENPEAGSSAQLYSTEIGSYDIPSRNRIDYRGNDADNWEAHGGGRITHGGGRVAQCGQVDLDSRRSNPNHGKGEGKTGFGVRKTGTGRAVQNFPRESSSYKNPGRNQTDFPGNDEDNKEVHGGGRVALYDQDDFDSRCSSQNRGKGGNTGYREDRNTGFVRAGNADYRDNDADNKESRRYSRLAPHLQGDFDSRDSNPNLGKEGGSTGFRGDGTQYNTAQLYPRESDSNDNPDGSWIDDYVEALRSLRALPRDQGDIFSRRPKSNHGKGEENAGCGGARIRDPPTDSPPPTPPPPILRGIDFYGKD